MKHKAAVSMLFAGSLLLGACTHASSSDGPTGSTAAADSTATATRQAGLNALLPASIKSAGTLQVATDPTYPPFEYMASDNKTLIGADIDLIQQIGQRLGVKVDLHPASFDAIIPGMGAKKYDVAVSGMADQPARRKSITFVDYAKNTSAFMVRTADKAKYTTWASACGAKLAVQSGTSMSDDSAALTKECTSHGKPAAKVSAFRTQDEVTLAVQSGRADIAVSTGGSAAAIVKSTGTQFVLVNPKVAGNIAPPGALGVVVPLGIAVQKDQPQLVKAIQAALKSMIADGTYKSIMVKWGLMDCCSNPDATVNGGTV